MSYSPVFEMLKKYAFEKRARFHMPGHKGTGTLFDGIGADLVRMDVTELDFTDNLLNPSGAFKEAETLMAKRAKSFKSYFLTGGSTLGNQTMIMSCLKEEEKILVDRFCHISVFSALAFSGAVPRYIENAYADKSGVLGCIDDKMVAKAIKENPDAKAVFVTSPNSFGQVAPLEKISRLCKENNMLLLVDEAHGAHFPYSDLLPKSAMECGADASVVSYHKTMPALTQSAVLHIGNEKLCSRAEETLHMLMTSSSSFLLAASIDYARSFMENEGKEKIQQLIRLIEENRPENVLKTADPLRIVALCDGEKYISAMRGAGMEPEMYGKGFMVFIVTAADDCENVLKLLNILSTLPKSEYVAPEIPKAEIKVTPGQAFKLQGRECSLEDACGKVSKKALYAYPPGVPAVLPGSVLDEKIINFIKSNNLEGIRENKINIIEGM